MLPMSIPTSLHASLLARLDSLAPTREVVQIGAALGRSFSYELISAAAEMPKQKLDEALDKLATAELIFRRGLPPDAEYTFKHALVQDAAYSTLLRSKRQQLHARIAALLERKFPEVATSTPEVLARHYTDAGNAAQGVAYWLKAGEAALQRSTLAEAGVHLKNGLSLVKEIKDEKVRAGLELRLQVTLALALSGSKGLGAPEVEQAYLRARALCDQIGATPQLFPVLYGLFIFRWVRGEVQLAHSIAEEMLSIAIKADDTALLLIAHFSLGGVLYHIGDCRAALDHLQQARARYDEKKHAALAFAYGVDFGVWLLNYLGVTHLVLGFPDKGSQASQEASTLARRLNHPLSLSNALIFNAMCSIHRRDWTSARSFAEAAGKLAAEHGFLHYLAITTAQIAWTLPHLGSVNEGI